MPNRQTWKIKIVLRFFPNHGRSAINRKKEHLLTDIVVITLAGVVCGAEKWNQIELLGHPKKA